MSDECKSEAQAAAEGSWEPDQNSLALLVDMGFSRHLATKALFVTGNTSVDLAAAWILEGGENMEFEALGSDDSSNALRVKSGRMHKMVFVVNKELNMGVGKVAAQVAHSALGIYRLLMQDEGKWGEMLLDWQHFGEVTIVLGGDNTKHLVELEKQALLIGLPTYLVQDAGLTQVPGGSLTVLGIMGRTDRLDQVTGKLRLL